MSTRRVVGRPTSVETRPRGPPVLPQQDSPIGVQFNRGADHVKLTHSPTRIRFVSSSVMSDSSLVEPRQSRRSSWGTGHRHRQVVERLGLRRLVLEHAPVLGQPSRYDVGSDPGSESVGHCRRSGRGRSRSRPRRRSPTRQRALDVESQPMTRAYSLECISCRSLR